MAPIEEPITPGRHLRAQSLLEADIPINKPPWGLPCPEQL